MLAGERLKMPVRDAAIVRVWFLKRTFIKEAFSKEETIFSGARIQGKTYGNTSIF